MRRRHRDPYKTLAKLLLVFAGASLVVLGLIIGAAGYAVTARLNAAPTTISTPLSNACTHYVTREGGTVCRH